MTNQFNSVSAPDTPPLLDVIRDLARTTREHSAQIGALARAVLFAMKGAKGLAPRLDISVDEYGLFSLIERLSDELLDLADSCTRDLPPEGGRHGG